MTASTTALRLVERCAEAEGVATFRFEATPALAFQAGQYVRLTLRHPEPDGRGVSRTFTISSAPSEPLVAITTRLDQTSSSFKRALGELAPGAVVEARGPWGGFVFGEEDRPSVFVAGGIGITPFRSILVDLAARSRRPDVTLLYANRGGEFPFQGQLDRLAEEWPMLRVAYTATRPGPEWRGAVGRIDAAFVARHVPDLAARRFFVAGSDGMVDAIVDLLNGMGVGSERIAAESFPGYEEAALPATAG
jgi:ferredoxin-NADP reductase